MPAQSVHSCRFFAHCSASQSAICTDGLRPFHEVVVGHCFSFGHSFCFLFLFLFLFLFYFFSFCFLFFCFCFLSFLYCFTLLFLMLFRGISFKFEHLLLWRQKSNIFRFKKFMQIHIQHENLNSDFFWKCFLLSLLLAICTLGTLVIRKQHVRRYIMS